MPGKCKKSREDVKERKSRKEEKDIKSRVETENDWSHFSRHIIHKQVKGVKKVWRFNNVMGKLLHHEGKIAAP